MLVFTNNDSEETSLLKTGPPKTGKGKRHYLDPQIRLNSRSFLLKFIIQLAIVIIIFILFVFIF